MTVDWANRWVAFKRKGEELGLQVQEEVAMVEMCQVLELENKLKGGNEVIMARVLLVQSEEEVEAPVPRELTKVLAQYEDVFETPSTLPPNRACDHRIHTDARC